MVRLVNLTTPDHRYSKHVEVRNGRDRDDVKGQGRNGTARVILRNHHVVYS